MSAERQSSVPEPDGGNDPGIPGIRRQLESLHDDWRRNWDGFDYFSGSSGSYDAMQERSAAISGQILVLERTLVLHDSLPDIPLARLTGLSPATHREIKRAMERTFGIIRVEQELASGHTDEEIRASLTELNSYPQRF
jgi:hypothetical protein